MPTPRERILRTAGKVFGRKGFKATTVREICQGAKVNLAAVNYYFGGKLELYRHVVLTLFARTFDKYPVTQGLPADPTPEARLQAFIHAMLLRMLAPGSPAGDPQAGQIIARELSDPSPVLDNLFADYIQPHAEQLINIIAAIAGRQLPPAEAARHVFSIMGQCTYYALAQPIVLRITPLDLENPATIKMLAEHISRFSIAGIKWSPPVHPPDSGPASGKASSEEAL